MNQNIKNKLRQYIDSANRDLKNREVKILPTNNNTKQYYLKIFLKFIINSINNTKFKNIKFTETVLDEVLTRVKIPFSSNNQILNEVIIIINESVKNKYNENEFIEKIKNIDNIDRLIEENRERITRQIIDSKNSGISIKDKIEDSIKDVESKVISGELKENSIYSAKSESYNKIVKTHKYTLSNIIDIEISKLAIMSESNIYQNDNILNKSVIEEHSLIIYTILETLNSLDIIGTNFIKENIINN